MNSKPSVIVGMSGGVDSSVAARLLLDQGYPVEGLFMKNWEEDDGTEYCTAQADLEDARQVASALGIRLHEANFAAEYWDGVFQHFLAEYRAGRTPNPDILCNREIKFRAFLDYALHLGAERIATGHYARLETRDGQQQLLKAADPDKDQSYFLCAVPESALARVLFPLGEMRKSAVRQIARDCGFVTHDKKDSTGICFIGERRFRDFLQTYLPAQPGPIETPSGELLGEHLGLMYYTLGQRQGIGLGGVSGHREAAWYVAAKDLERNALIVVQGDHPLLYCRQASLRDFNWINGRPEREEFAAAAKTRYRQPDQRCTVSIEGDGVTLTFAEPQRAVTPGQAAVLYDGDRCLGGGTIEMTKP